MSEDNGAVGFGALLRARRRSAELTQQQLAGLAGVSVAAIRDLEQGRTAWPRRGSAARLARALGLDELRAAELALAALNGTARDVGMAVLPAASGLWLQVLGPLAAWRDGEQVMLGAPKQRAVLALLAMHPGTLVHRDTITDSLWGRDPPATAVHLVQAYVSRLRQVLDAGPPAQGAARHLASSGTGYQLHATEDELDLLAFGQHLRRAQAARSAGDPGRACDMFDLALELWRGDPLTDIDVLREHPAAVGLAGWRTAAILDYAHAASAMGWHDRVLPHLRLLAGREPLNEGAHAQLMIALAGTGQQAAALHVYDDLRRRLDDQLGIEPCPELRTAHLRVLRQDLTPARRESATVTSAGGGLRPGFTQPLGAGWWRCPAASPGRAR